MSDLWDLTPEQAQAFEREFEMQTMGQEPVYQANQQSERLGDDSQSQDWSEYYELKRLHAQATEEDRNMSRLDHHDRHLDRINQDQRHPYDLPEADQRFGRGPASQMNRYDRVLGRVPERSPPRMHESFPMASQRHDPSHFSHSDDVDSGARHRWSDRRDRDTDARLRRNEYDKNERGSRESHDLGRREHDINVRSRSRDRVIVRSRSRDRVTVRSRSRDRVTVRSRSRDRIIVRSRSRDRVIARSRSRDRIIVRSKSRDRVIARSRSRDRVIARGRGRAPVIAKGRSRDRHIDVRPRGRDQDTGRRSRSRDRDNDVRRTSRDTDIVSGIGHRPAPTGSQQVSKSSNQNPSILSPELPAKVTTNSSPQAMTKVTTTKPSLGETRKVSIKISSKEEVVGFQIESGSDGGIFIMDVAENSLASSNGLVVGDQLLKFCGINFESASEEFAKRLMQSCRFTFDTFDMFVKFNPDGMSQDPPAKRSPSPEAKSTGPKTKGSPEPRRPLPAKSSAPKPKATPEAFRTLPAESSAPKPQTIPLPPKSHVTASKLSSSMSAPRYVIKPGKPQVGETRTLSISSTSKIEDVGFQVDRGPQGGIFVSAVTKNSLAAKNSIVVGDQILEFCGINFKNFSKEFATKIMHTYRDKFEMVVQYNPDMSKQSSSGSSSTVPGASSANSLPQVSPTPAKAKTKKSNSRKISIKKSTKSEDVGLRIERGSQGGIFVSVVTRNSKAAKNNIVVGDQILEFCGIDFQNVTQELATRLLNSSRDTLKLVLLAKPDTKPVESQPAQVTPVQVTPVQVTQVPDKPVPDSDPWKCVCGNVNDAINVKCLSCGSLKKNQKKKRQQKGLSQANMFLPQPATFWPQQAQTFWPAQLEGYQLPVTATGWPAQPEGYQLPVTATGWPQQPGSYQLQQAVGWPQQPQPYWPAQPEQFQPPPTAVWPQQPEASWAPQPNTSQAQPATVWPLQPEGSWQPQPDSFKPPPPLQPAPPPPPPPATAGWPKQPKAFKPPLQDASRPPRPASFKKSPSEPVVPPPLMASCFAQPKGLSHPLQTTPIPDLMHDTLTKWECANIACGTINDIEQKICKMCSLPVAAPGTKWLTYTSWKCANHECGIINDPGMKACKKCASPMDLSDDAQPKVDSNAPSYAKWEHFLKDKRQKNAFPKHIHKFAASLEQLDFVKQTKLDDARISVQKTIANLKGLESIIPGLSLEKTSANIKGVESNKPVTKHLSFSSWLCSNPLCGIINAPEQIVCKMCSHRRGPPKDAPGKPVRGQPVPDGNSWKCLCGHINEPRSLRCLGCKRLKIQNQDEGKPVADDESWKCVCGKVNEARYVRCLGLLGCSRQRMSVLDLPKTGGKPLQDNPVQDNPVQDNPVQDNPVQDNPVQDKQLAEGDSWKCLCGKINGDETRCLGCKRLKTASLMQTAPQLTVNTLAGNTLELLKTSPPNVKLVMENKAGLELKDLLTHITVFAQDKDGAQFIQEKLTKATPVVKKKVFNEVLASARALIVHPFGHALVQTFFIVGSIPDKVALALSLRGHVYELSLYKYASQVIHHFLSLIPERIQISLIHDLNGHVLECIKNQFASHVLHRALECLEPEHLQFISAAVHRQVLELSTHIHACKVIQNIIQYCTAEQTVLIIAEINQHFDQIVCDKKGKYVIQAVITYGSEDGRSKIIKKISVNLDKLSKDEFAMKAIQTGAECLDSSELSAVIVHLCVEEENQQLESLKMLQQQTARCAAERFIEVANKSDFTTLLKTLRVNTYQQSHGFVVGREIIARIKPMLDQEDVKTCDATSRGYADIHKDQILNQEKRILRSQKQVKAKSEPATKKDMAPAKKRQAEQKQDDTATPKKKSLMDPAESTITSNTQSDEATDQAEGSESLDATPDDANTITEQEIWIVGSSIIHWAQDRALSRDLLNIGLNITYYKVCWMGACGMVWNDLRKNIQFEMMQRTVPCMIVTHVGGNDLAKSRLSPLMKRITRHKIHILSFNKNYVGVV